MKKPNFLINFILGFFLRIFAFIKGQRIIKKCKINGPAIILSNHTSFYDFLYTISAMYPKRVTYLAAKKFFYEPKMRFVMKLARAIPKSLLTADPVATLNLFRILKQNGIVGIFPEGQISAIGKTLPLSFAITKLIKKAKVDVYIVKHYGAGLANPPWSTKTFKGRIETVKELIITKEELKTLSSQEIYDIVSNKLEYSAWKDNFAKKYKYKINDVDNLENVIYQCPNCLHEGLIAKKNQLICPACNHVLTYDEFGLLNGRSVEELFLEQEKRIRNKIDSDKDFTVSEETRLMSFRDNLLVEVGSGVLTIKDFEYIYNGTVDNEVKEIRFNAKNIPSLPSDIGRNIQIYDGEMIYQFELKNKFMPTKMVHIGEYLYQLSNKEEEKE
ncbi:MAG: 1-acyl-sn-glycerol-3-phosphate acyltransferase [Candidatus Izemoplasmatales bacterium]|jgi:1-acyl-sn-glycerol-3-phosphate acyltransferase|nr:1-acyl-sn-glycerol-3-phosphate acyltransferase [Candidatus Izemoplasmatales bacterium]